MDKIPLFKFSRDWVGYSDILCVFHMRLLEMKSRRFFRECTVDTNEYGAIVGNCPDEEAMIAYLAVVRQFILQKSPIELIDVRRHLSNIGKRLGDGSIGARLAEAEQKHKTQKRYCLYRLHGENRTKTTSHILAEYKDPEVIDFWLNSKYFHTETKGGNSGFRVAVKTCGSERRSATSGGSPGGNRLRQQGI